MILEGYPFAEHPHLQPDVWQRIQANNSELGLGWKTDPDGLQRTLMQFGGDPNVNWGVLHDPSAAVLMHTIGYWMTKLRFPVAALADPTGASLYGSFQHWVVVEGFTTDLDPTTNTSTVLKSVDISDPAPACGTDINRGGIRSTVDSATWYGVYWRTSGKFSNSQWDGEYVAVVEPPLQKGIAKAPKSLLNSGSLISGDNAKEAARKWFSTYAFDKKYAELQKVSVAEAFLVNEKDMGYYLVTLVETSQKDARGAILVNAYNGDFEEIGVYQSRIHYLDDKEAVQIALKNCACGKAKLAQLVVHPLLHSQSRYLPIWKIVFEFGIIYVSQQGAVVHPLGPGD